MYILDFMNWNPGGGIILNHCKGDGPTINETLVLNYLIFKHFGQENSTGMLCHLSNLHIFEKFHGAGE